MKEILNCLINSKTVETLNIQQLSPLAPHQNGLQQPNIER
jgi:hypothetical protein